MKPQVTSPCPMVCCSSMSLWLPAAWMGFIRDAPWGVRHTRGGPSRLSVHILRCALVHISFWQRKLPIPSWRGQKTGRVCRVLLWCCIKPLQSCTFRVDVCLYTLVQPIDVQTRNAECITSVRLLVMQHGALQVCCVVLGLALFMSEMAGG